MLFGIPTTSSSLSTFCWFYMVFTSTWLRNGTRKRLAHYNSFLHIPTHFCTFFWLIDSYESFRILHFSCHWQTWMYLAVPLALYVCERLIRALRSSIQPVTIIKVITIFCHICICIHLVYIANIEEHLILFYTEGCCLSWKCLVTSHVQARGIQLQKRAIHVCQLCCSVAIRMVYISKTLL